MPALLGGIPDPQRGDREGRWGNHGERKGRLKTHVFVLGGSSLNTLESGLGHLWGGGTVWRPFLEVESELKPGEGARDATFQQNIPDSLVIGMPGPGVMLPTKHSVYPESRH